MSLTLALILVAVGVIGAGYVFYRWRSASETVINKTADVVNKVIDSVKK